MANLSKECKRALEEAMEHLKVSCQDYTSLRQFEHMCHYHKDDPDAKNHCKLIPEITTKWKESLEKLEDSVKKVLKCNSESS